MTNKETFVKTFGHIAYNQMIQKLDEKGKLEAIDIYKWLIDEAKIDNPIHLEKKQIVKPVIVEARPNDGWNPQDPRKTELKKKKVRVKASGSGRKVGDNYDIKWYLTAVENFYLSDEPSISFRLDEDKSSGSKVTTLDGFACRFITAIRELDLQDEVQVHRYNQRTTNAVVCLSKNTECVNRFKTVVM